MAILTKIFLAACMATTMLAGGALAQDTPVPAQAELVVTKVPPFLSHISMLLPPKHNKTSSLILSSSGAEYGGSTASLTLSNTSVAHTMTAIPGTTPPVATNQPCEYGNMTTTVFVTVSACVSFSIEYIKSSVPPSASSNSSTPSVSTTPVSSFEDPSNTAKSLYSHWSGCHSGTGTGVPSTVGNITYHMPTPTAHSTWSLTNTNGITVSQSMTSSSSSSETSGTTSIPIADSSTSSMSTATPTSSGEPMFTGAAGKFAGDGNALVLVVGAVMLGFMAVML